MTLACVQLEMKMHDQAKETLSSCMSKFGQDGWLSLRSDCGHLLLQISLETRDTPTMLQAALLLMHPDVTLPSGRKLDLEQAVVALLNGYPREGLQPLPQPLVMQVDQHHRLLRLSCAWEKTSQIVEESGVLCVRVTSTCSVQPLCAATLHVDMHPPPLSFTVSHLQGACGVRPVDFKDKQGGTAQADLVIDAGGSGSLLQFSVRVDAVGLVYPKGFTFTIGSGKHALQLTCLVSVPVVPAVFFCYNLSAALVAVTY